MHTNRGHAGSFGYEREHYDVSQTIAEQVLLPAVRKAPPETLVISDGFSCRHQIRDGTGRRAMHPAEVVALALERRADASIGLTERRYLDPAAQVTPAQVAQVAQVAAGVAAVAAIGALGALALRLRHR